MGTWSAAGSLTTARAEHTATLLSSGKVLVAGGYAGGAYLSSSELYDPTVAISPSSVTLAPQASQTFTASGGSGTGYTWAFVANASGGTLSATGVYTAGATGGVNDIIGVTDSLGNSATATVTVTAVTAPSNSGGCGATSGNTFPLLAPAVLLLMAWGRRTRHPSCFPKRGVRDLNP
jgi:hypothetical protein